MRIGILSFHTAVNYGAVLQLFALKKYIELLGGDVEIINYVPIKAKRYFNFFGLDKGLGKFIKKIIMMPFYLYKKKKFNKFIAKYMKLSDRVNNFESLRLLNSYFDTFIVGSDQVWNYKITGNDTRYLLDFVEESNKKNSYAASFGTSKIPKEYRERYINLLKDFANISVREKQGQKIVNCLCSKESTVVLDPTLLFDMKEWRNFFSNRAKYEKSKYILIYCMEPSSSIINVAKKISNDTGLKIIMINPFTELFQIDTSVMVAGPEDFISLFLNAEYVITNSFHGTVFSINFGKKFFVEYLSYTNYDVNSRIEHILDLFDLKDRLIIEGNNNDLYENIDYEKVNNILKYEREKSINYLTKILNNNE